MTEPVLTALVSTYASERYLQGCLDSLLQQTIADRIEIVVVDAASPEREGELVRAYQQRHANLRYVRTAARENSSRSFARGTELSRGRYLTTANADDRHHPEFAAKLCAVLDQHPEFAIAYADSRITHRDNETWARNTAVRKYAWPDFTLPTALSCCLFGAQPVWRRASHGAVGTWDPALERCNDQDLFLRIARHGGAVHVAEDLGLFLMRPDSVSGAVNRQATLQELLQVLRHHRTTTPLEVLFPALAGTADPATGRAAAWFELGNLAALGPYTDAQWALQCYAEAVRQPVAEGTRQLLREAFANNTGALLAAAGEVDRAARAFAQAGQGPAAVANRARLAAGKPSRQPRDYAFVELPHPVVEASRTTRALVVGSDGRTRWTPSHTQLPWDVFDGPNGVPVPAAAPAKAWSIPAPDQPPAAPAALAAGPAPAAPRRVLLVGYGFADSGGGTMLPRAFAHELASRGAAVTFCYAAAKPAPELGPYGVRRSREGAVELVAIHNRPSAFMDLGAPRREIDDPVIRQHFAALLDEVRPEVVHFWNLHNLGMSLPQECRARGIPTVLSSNNYWAVCPRLYLISERLQRCSGPSQDGSRCAQCLGTPGRALDHAARRRAGVELLRHGIDVHLAVSQRVRDLYVQNGDDPGHVRVLRQEPPAVAEIWQRTGQRRPLGPRQPGRLRVGYIGSVMAHKGVHVLAAALQQLPAGAVEAVALGDVAPGYREVLQRLDPGGRLHLTGRYDQDRLPELLAALDVVVVPSVWDDCAPFVVAEALAARCPVLGARIGGIPDFVVEGGNGLLFAPDDPAALAACLQRLVRDPALLPQLQQGITPPRGLPAFVDDVLAVYDELRQPAAVG